MENQPQNPEFRSNPENFHPCKLLLSVSVRRRIEGSLVFDSPKALL